MGTKTRREIDAADLELYLKDTSDFAFELKAHRKLQELKFKCEHAGTYCDPVTQKFRQFDTRAEKYSSRLRLRLAVECKNVSKAGPLLAHCVRRREEEAYTSVITPSFVRDADGKLFSHATYIEIFKRIDGGSIYGYGKDNYVCKSVNPVWEGSDGQQRDAKKYLVSKDEEIYEKWAQAVNSCYDLIQKEARYCSTTTSAREGTVSFIAPILLIPSGTLWRINFAEDGQPDGKVERASHVSFFLGHEAKPWVGIEDSSYAGRPYWISHLEIITYDHLESALSRIISIFEKDGYAKLS